ncbi:MAG: diguanylate cyclase [Desulfarculus sp.]|nr:diguanylate cyclase [Desulfarculus sp.]
MPTSPIKKTLVALGLFLAMTYHVVGAWAMPDPPRRGLALSGQQEQWLEKNSPLRAGVWTDSPPLAFTEVDGKPRGIVVDYLSLIERRLGARLSLRVYSSMAKAQAGLRRGEVDLAPVVLDGPDRDLTYSEPFLSVPVVVMTRAESSGINGLADLAGKLLMVKSLHPAEFWFRRDHPQIKLAPLEDDGGLWTVAEGRADGMIGGLLDLVWAARSQGISNLKVALATGYSYQLALAMRPEQAPLAEIVNQVLATLGQDERQEIYHRWAPVQVDGLDWGQVWRFGGVTLGLGLMLLGLVIYWNRRLAAEVKRRREAEAVLTSTKRRFETVFQSQLDAILVLDSSHPPLIVDCNGAAERVFGYRKEDMLGRGTSILHLDHEHQERLLDRLYQGMTQQGFFHESDYEMIRQDGRVFPCELSIAPLSDDQGERLGWICVVRDVSERKLAQEERRRLFDLSPDLLSIMDFDGYFREINLSWTKVTGWSQEQLKARPWHELVHPDDRPAIRDAGRRLIHGQTVTDFENRFKCKDGSWIWLNWSSSALASHGLVYSVAHDITQRKRMEGELARLATTDWLTGVANRQHFLELASQEFKRSRRYGKPMMVVMIDMDRFKDINDTYGHAMGDELLRQAARACRQSLRDSDIFGRLGGEEFAAVLVEADLDEGRMVAERLREALAGLRTGLETDGPVCTASLGLAQMDPRDQRLDDLLKRASAALYQAKRTGRNLVAQL